MGITLYTAPDCIRCKIVKAFLAERGLAYDTVDFKADAQEFNTFYRANRKAIYRTPEGVEFPLFHDGEVIKQGSGEVIAYMLSGHTLESCVTRSDMLHGKIAGLYPSQCPAGQEDNFEILVNRLAAGGLQVWLQTDGRKPELLEKLLKIKDVNVICNMVGGHEASTKIFGGAPTKEELAKTIALVQATPGGVVRFLAMPLPSGDGWQWPQREDAAAAAKLVAEACGQPTMPYSITPIAADSVWDMRGLDPLPDQNLLMYRSASRQHMFKADIVK